MKEKLKDVIEDGRWNWFGLVEEEEDSQDNCFQLKLQPLISIPGKQAILLVLEFAIKLSYRICRNLNS